MGECGRRERVAAGTHFAEATGALARQRRPIERQQVIAIDKEILLLISAGPGPCRAVRHAWLDPRPVCHHRHHAKTRRSDEPIAQAPWKWTISITGHIRILRSQIEAPALWCGEANDGFVNLPAGEATADRQLALPAAFCKLARRPLTIPAPVPRSRPNPPLR